MDGFMKKPQVENLVALRAKVGAARSTQINILLREITSGSFIEQLTKNCMGHV
jgi:hypothetical protein